MRKIVSVLMALALLCSLCACGGQTRTEPEAPAENQAAEPAPKPEDPAPAPETPAEEPAKPAGDPEAAARGLVGRPVSEL